MAKSDSQKQIEALQKAVAAHQEHIEKLQMRLEDLSAAVQTAQQQSRRQQNPKKADGGKPLP